ncbi:MAG TPA: flagellar protein FlaG [Thermodesulfobacteriota bacterium]
MSFDFKISAIRTAAVQGDINWQHKKAQAVAADPQKAEPSPETETVSSAQELEKAATDVQIILKRLNTELRFEVDSALKEVLVKIVDPDTGEVIRHIPSEEVVALRKKMKELVGILYGRK